CKLRSGDYPQTRFGLPVPGQLVHTQGLRVAWAWVAVTVKPGEPSAQTIVAIVQVTPDDSVKPGSEVQLPARYASLSTKYASSEVAALRASEEMRALKPRAR